VRKAFDKQSGRLLENLNHPSLRAKKYNQTLGLWQARVTRSWRFYFTIEGARVAATLFCHVAATLRAGGYALLAGHHRDSNSLRGTPDIRIMDCSVPMRSSL
jgi:hypothetical protein